jgi:glucose-1-phosphate thymidylyltransferase
MAGEATRARGLICAGGEATRLQELTRITNKHLLPVGRWPMVYYSSATAV